jgi:NAD(P)-dependent dehydrogenase (short-subunit alcohol dehydrogenase family)
LNRTLFLILPLYFALFSNVPGEMHNLVQTIKLSPPIDTTAPYDASTLAGKTILITGGAKGFGATFARYWASHGAHIVIGDVDDAAGEALVAELRTKDGPSSGSSAGKQHQRHHFSHCDVTVWEDQVALFEAAARSSPHGGIDVVVANAGVLDPSSAAAFENPIVDEKGEGSRFSAPKRPNVKVLEVNSIGVAYTAHLAMFWLAQNNATNSDNPLPITNPTPVEASVNGQGQRRRDRCLLLIGSVAGIMAFPGQAQYCMSKHAVTGLFRALRATAALQRGVRITMLCPYFTGDTNMLPGPVEAALLAGGAGSARVEDVVDAATRLVADQDIVGRALAVGPRVSVREVEGVVEYSVAKDEGKGGGVGKVGDERKKAEDRGKLEVRAIWECFADDYEQCDVFVWRFVKILNVVRQARGIVGWASDVIKFLLGRN